MFACVGFIFEGLPLTEEAVRAFLSLKYTPDIVLSLSVDTEYAVKRRFVMPELPPKEEKAPDAFDDDYGSGNPYDDEVCSQRAYNCIRLLLTLCTRD